MEDGLRLATKTSLFPVVTTLTLSKEGGLASLVLCHLVLLVAAALGSRAVCVADFGDVDLEMRNLTAEERRKG